jgi:hypothetical protein
MTVQIYQINDSNDEYTKFLFRDYDYFKNKNKTNLNSILKMYNKKYEYNDTTYDKTINPNKILNSIFEKFNIDRPDDFTGWSLSVSDIIVLDDIYYMVDSFGFEQLN